MASSKLPIYSALAANLFISITKFVAAGVTGSSAMISEGIHSLVDTINEILLLVGIHQSKKPADEKRPFGYGKELYFWAFVVSVLIFGVGGGISFYEGVTHLLHPHPLEDPQWNYIVLAFALLFDGISFVIAFREFNRQRGDTPFWQAVKRSKDPTTFVVLFEDAADVLGLGVAFLGVFLGHYYNNSYFDAVASILIGFILTAISIVLARESRSLLMGESLSKTALDKIVTISSLSCVEKVHTPLSMYLSPEEVILVLPVSFKTELNPTDLQEAILVIKKNIKDHFPDIKQIYIEPQSHMLK
jgi:cation diffusion facilitator family transporter